MNICCFVWVLNALNLLSLQIVISYSVVPGRKGKTTSGYKESLMHGERRDELKGKKNQTKPSETICADMKIRRTAARNARNKERLI